MPEGRELDVITFFSREDREYDVKFYKDQWLNKENFYFKSM